MSIDKTTAINQLGNNPSVANQQSLVQKLAGPQINKPIRMLVPGGASLTEFVSKDQLSTAVFTWLRRVRHFKDVLISFADDPSNLDCHLSTIVDFNQNHRLPQWEVEGKKWLAERVSEVLAMDNVVAAKIDKSGIHAYLDKAQQFSPSSENWLPNLVFTPNKPKGF